MAPAIENAKEVVGPKLAALVKIVEINKRYQVRGDRFSRQVYQSFSRLQ